MNHRPHLKEYVMARLVTMAVALFVVFSALLIAFIPDNYTVSMAVFLLALGFGIFVLAIYRGAKRMQKELTTINTYLKDLDKVDTIHYKTHFYPRV